MKLFIQRLQMRLQYLTQDEGQDLVEYALIVALIALAATAGMSSLASSINTAFTAVGTTLTGYTG
jgi:pilus assembly protein Flp/PilA